MLVKTEKFIKNYIHYIKEIYSNGFINIYTDPEFQEPSPELTKPPLPPLTSTGQKLDFIINELNLKNRFKPHP